MKIKSRGSQVFNVPNNEEGQLFLRLLRKFRNRGWRYRARGRGSRKEHGNREWIPQQYSEWLALYLGKEGEYPWGIDFTHVHYPAPAAAPAPPPAPENEIAIAGGGGVELTWNEQKVLESILKSITPGVKYWPQEDAETFETLFNKLVD